MRRTHPAPDVYGEDDHWDVAMRDAVQRESVDLLRHQMEVERGARASMQRTDFLVSLVVAGLSVGFGAGSGVFKIGGK